MPYSDDEYRNDLMNAVSHVMDSSPVDHQIIDDECMGVSFPLYPDWAMIIGIQDDCLIFSCRFGDRVRKKDVDKVLRRINQVNSELLYGRFYLIPKARLVIFCTTMDCDGLVPEESKIREQMSLVMATIIARKSIIFDDA